MKILFFAINLVVPFLVSAYISEKRGLVQSTAWGAQLCGDLAVANLSWHYAWSFFPGNLTCSTLLTGSTKYVALAWGKGSAPTSMFQNVTALLGFNEPNHANQANMTPSEAAALWPSLMAAASVRRIPLGSPAVVGSVSDGRYALCDSC
jgi:hypothetical protein